MIPHVPINPLIFVLYATRTPPITLSLPATLPPLDRFLQVSVLLYLHNTSRLLIVVPVPRHEGRGALLVTYLA